MASALRHTPDGRYIVIESRAGPRLWRASNPGLTVDRKTALTRDLMNARRAIRDAAENAALIQMARRKVQEAKEQLGERGPVWWTDGAPDFNRRLVKNTPYFDWWISLTS